MKRYELIDHTADIAIKAYGATLEEAFACIAGAMFDIITDEATITSLRRIELEVESDDRESLLVAFLSGLIVKHEVESLVLNHFAVTFVGENRLKASAWGEQFDETRHGGGTHVKGVSYHMMEIVDGKGETPCHVQVLFDV
ncbi:MAG: archease [bacterium]